MQTKMFVTLFIVFILKMLKSRHHYAPIPQKKSDLKHTHKHTHTHTHIKAIESKVLNSPLFLLIWNIF